MTRSPDEPERLLSDDETDPLVRRVLGAGLGERPSSDSLRAAPLAIVAILSSKAATAGALSSGVSATVTALGVAKWAALGALVGASTLGAVELARPSTAPRASVSAQTHKPELKPPDRRVQLPLTEVADPAFSADLRSEPPAGIRDSSSPSLNADAEPRRMAPTADLSRELALLDAARVALLRSEPERALALLTQAKSLPERALAPEATVLEVKALLACGREEQARQVAERFRRSAPKSPQGSVLRELLTAVDKP